MDLLHLVTDQAITESHVKFICHVAELTKSKVTMLYVAEEQKRLKSAWMSLENVRALVPDAKLQIKLLQGDPIDVILDEVEAHHYDMLVLGLRRRRRIVPSSYRFLSQKLVRKSPLPVLLVRKVNLKLRRILICSGGLDISMPVVKTSASLAGSARLEATLLHVLGSVPSMYTGMDVMEETLKEVLATDTPLSQHLKTSAEVLAKNNIDSKIELRQGAVAEEILNEAEEGKYDLIVLGDTERYSVPRVLMSDITQQIINRAKSAVLVVK